MAKEIKACGSYAKIHSCAFGMAIGLTWGLGMFCLTLCFMWFGIGEDLLDALGSIYVGYDGTFLGGLIGLIWGLIDGFIGGLIVGFLYNKCLSCCPICKCFCGKKK